MVNSKEKAKTENDRGQVVLPLEFFYHHIGRFLTKNAEVIVAAAADE